MSKTLSQSISKETGLAIAIVVGLCIYIIIVICVLAPGIMILVRQPPSNTGTDPIDRATVNAAIKYIQPD
jgi:hypothetical protein